MHRAPSTAGWMVGGWLLIGLAGIAYAESAPMPPCTCNDDCWSQGYGQYCQDYSWGRYCGYALPGIPCTDAGVIDAGIDAQVIDGGPRDAGRDGGDPGDGTVADDRGIQADADPGPNQPQEACSCAGPAGRSAPLLETLLLCAFLGWIRRRASGRRPAP